MSLADILKTTFRKSQDISYNNSSGYPQAWRCGTRQENTSMITPSFIQALNSTGNCTIRWLSSTGQFNGATETSRNITARVIERDTSREISYFLEDSRVFRARQQCHKLRQNAHQLGRQK
ncbi:hypothetical protein TNCV_949241 [Trichonephila clavipes]|nr:hypothetical protein TNCV_949241 [Trichonephila clavipes]